MHACDRRVHASCTFAFSSTRTYLVPLPRNFQPRARYACMPVSVNYEPRSSPLIIIRGDRGVVEIFPFVSLVWSIIFIVYVYISRYLDARRKRFRFPFDSPFFQIDNKWGFIKDSCTGSFVSASSIEPSFYYCRLMRCVIATSTRGARGEQWNEKLDLLYCAQVSLFVNYPRCINAIECRDGVPRKINSRLFRIASSRSDDYHNFTVEHVVEWLHNLSLPLSLHPERSSTLRERV